MTTRIGINTIAAIFFLFISAAMPLNGAAEQDRAAHQPLNVREIAAGVFLSQGTVEVFSPANHGHISNIGFIVGAQAVAVIDTGGSFTTGQALLAAIKLRTDLPVRHVINTHMHPDHIFGNAAFVGDDVSFWGHSKLTSALQRRGQQYLQANSALLGKAAFDGTQIVLPNRTVEDTAEIDLGGRVLDLKARPTAHTDNDITVFDRQTKTLWLGDLLFTDHVPALDGSILGWLTVMEHLSEVDAKWIVPGHGPATDNWPEALGPQRRYLEKLTTEIRMHLQNGTTLAEAAKTTGLSERDAWSLFDEYNARNVAAAYTELEWE